MKSTKQYIKELKLEAKKFPKTAFIREFTEEFYGRVDATKLACENHSIEFTYDKFLHIIKEMNTKFNAISNKIAGHGTEAEPLPNEMDEALFNRFFATVVIPARMELFPKEHAIATQKRLDHSLNTPKVLSRASTEKEIEVKD